MTDATLDREQIQDSTHRLLGFHDGAANGPLLLSVSGIHGNEHAGVAAVRRVLEALRTRRPPFNGRFVALAGNLRALRSRQRYQDLDLNRIWLPERVEALIRSEPEPRAAAEDLEQRELLQLLARELDGRERSAYFLDLHTSSAEGPPFLTVGDTLRNRVFARCLGLPIVLGLEEQIDGALLEFLNNHGHVTAGVEAGHHEASSSVERHEAVLWLALLAAGHLQERDLPDAEAYRSRLREATPGVSGFLEVRARHAVQARDRFVMRPGLRNFDRVRAGEAIARDARGPIGAPGNGRILLPLYQRQGDDGFFMVQRIRPFWLKLSWLLRRLGAPRWVRLLPGVRPHPHIDGTLVVNTRIARLLPVQIFHLLGFRKRRRQGNLLLFSRRRHDVLPGTRVVPQPLDPAARR